MTEHGGRGPMVRGQVVDDQTRCVHYHGPDDVIAIKFFCCDTYYPCHQCHQDVADHPVARWPVGRRAEAAILCGVCGTELSITHYLITARCPACGARFNERCALHHHLYFEGI